MQTPRALRWFVATAALMTEGMTLFALPATAGAGVQGGLGPRKSPPVGAPGNLDAQSHSARGSVVADSGFSVSKDGFSFPNYGEEPGVENLTPTEMEAIFGPAVCASQRGGTCRLTPPAATVLNEWNATMNGGHCYGMSVTALLFFKKQLSPAAYGGTSASNLRFGGNAAFQRRIAQSFVFQYFPSVTKEAIGGTPRRVLEALIARLRVSGPESWTIGFFKSNFTGGHAVTPFKVVDYGKGKYGIKIYDNNFPGAVHTIRVNTRTNSWSYVASTEPNAPADWYSGNAATKTLFLFPTLPGTRVQPCGFCSHERAPDYAPAADEPQDGPSPSGTGPGVRLIALGARPDDHGHLVLTDPQGQKTGFVGGRFVNLIPGVKVLFPMLDKDFSEAEEPIYEVPTGFPLAVTLDGSSLRRRSVSSLEVAGPAYTTTIDHIVLQPKQRDFFDLASDSPHISYRLAGSRSPRVILGVDTTQADYSLAIKPHGVQAGRRLSFDLRLHDLVIDARSQPSPTTYEVRLVREVSSGPEPPVRRTLKLAAHSSVAVPYPAW